MLISGKRVVMLLSGFILFCTFSVRGDQRTYTVFSRYEADQNGKVLRQEPYGGRVVLYDNGRYYLKLHIEDKGRYQFVKAGKEQPDDTLYFYSDKKFQFFANPKGNQMALWVSRTKSGTHQWVLARLITENGSSGINPGGGLMKDTVFKNTTFYGTTSSPSYSRYHETTGAYLGDDTLGLVFRPDGTYALRLEFGGTIKKDKGQYRIQGNMIRVVFSDGSHINLMIKKNGRSLHWYSKGTLIGEYSLLQVIKR